MLLQTEVNLMLLLANVAKFVVISNRHAKSTEILTVQEPEEFSASVIDYNRFVIR